MPETRSRLREWAPLLLLLGAALAIRIVVAGFIQAAAAVGLGCCPVSMIRDRIDDLQAILARCGAETRLRVHPAENG